MNKKMRALNAMDGLAVDRIPVMLYRHYFDQNEDNNVNEYIDWTRKSGIDMLLIQVDGYDGCPIEAKTFTIEDLKNLRSISRNDKFITGQVDRAKRISEALSEEIAIFPVMYTPFNNIKKTLKYAFNNKLDIMKCWEDNKQVILDAMKYAEEANDILLDEYKRQTKVDGVMISFRNGGDDKMESEEYIKYLSEWDHRFLAHANLNFAHNITHLCGWYGGNDISLWKDYDYKTLNWDIHVEKNPINSRPLDIVEGRSYFRKDTVLMGGFDNRADTLLYSGTKEEIQLYTKELIRSVGKENFIMSSDCSIDYRIPVERIHWIIEACEEYCK